MEVMTLLKYNIIPKPAQYQTYDGSYCVSSATQVLSVPEFVSAANYLTAFLKTNPDPKEGAIHIKKVGGMQPESYTLKVSPQDIMITASDEAGAFYGVVTLKMILMQAEKRSGKAIVRALYIEDRPHYDYRGLQLDESRHFFGTEIVKQVLDNMAMLKLNTFHWHLTDDQGFRIESKEFPLLNEIGARRKYAGLKGCTLEHRGGEYYHYYTQEEIKDIVAYASKLHIEVIPEIDVPGHTLSILAAYPELSCNETPVEVFCQNGITKEILCAGKPEVYAFLDKLLGEMCALFPGRYFHIGGDEAADGHKNWAKCPKCQKVMQEEGLSNEKELQGYFMSRVNDILKKYGKTTMAWNDCINDSFDESIVCQYWIAHNLKAVREQAYKRDLIMSPVSHFYFDIKHAKISLKKVYSFNENKAGFGKPGQRIRGVECEHWSEWIDSKEALEFSMYPRVAAFAEVAWTELPNRDYKDFLQRLEWYKSFLKNQDIHYSRVTGRMWSARQRQHFSLGADGNEFKRSEELRLLEK